MKLNEIRNNPGAHKHKHKVLRDTVIQDHMLQVHMHMVIQDHMHTVIQVHTVIQDQFIQILKDVLVVIIDNRNK